MIVASTGDASSCARPRARRAARVFAPLRRGAARPERVLAEAGPRSPPGLARTSGRAWFSTTRVILQCFEETAKADTFCVTTPRFVHAQNEGLSQKARPAGSPA